MAAVTVLLQPMAADWEFGPVLSILRAYLNDTICIATPEGSPVETVGGLRVEADRMFDTADIDNADAVIVIGSDTWATSEDDNLQRRLRERVEAGKLTGAICAGTLALARAGVLDTRTHTSNGLGFLQVHVKSYGGAANYRDVPHAVVDGAMVTASASSPSSFAAAMARLLHPDQDAAQTYWGLARQEFETLGSDFTSILRS